MPSHSHDACRAGKCLKTCSDGVSELTRYPQVCLRAINEFTRGWVLQPHPHPLTITFTHHKALSIEGFIHNHVDLFIRSILRKSFSDFLNVCKYERYLGPRQATRVGKDHKLFFSNFIDGMLCILLVFCASLVNCVLL